MSDQGDKSRAKLKRPAARQFSLADACLYVLALGTSLGMFRMSAGIPAPSAVFLQSAAFRESAQFWAFNLAVFLAGMCIVAPIGWVLRGRKGAWLGGLIGALLLITGYYLYAYSTAMQYW